MTFPYHHAFITGGASGIGLGIADALLELGIAVTIADIDQQALDRAQAERGDKLAGLVLDVQDRNGWQQAKQQAEAKFGPVDILVNNAGITLDGCELGDLPPADFDRIVSIDLVGVFNGIQTFAQGFRQLGKGHIVNTASVMGLLAGVKGMGAYSAVKAAVVALTEALRKEMAPYNVGVSVLCPGFVASNLRQNSSRVVSSLKDQNRSADLQAMDGLTAGRCVVRGVERNLRYIFTHPEYAPHVMQRAEGICGDAGGVWESGGGSEV